MEPREFEEVAKLRERIAKLRRVADAAAHYRRVQRAGYVMGGPEAEMRAQRDLDTALRKAGYLEGFRALEGHLMAPVEWGVPHLHAGDPQKCPACQYIRDYPVSEAKRRLTKLARGLRSGLREIERLLQENP